MTVCLGPAADSEARWGYRFPMCGFCGVLNFDGGAPDNFLIEKMTRTIAHRGPDGEGFCNRGPLSLGHRRLAILDLSPAGRQPMSTSDGVLTLVYNGEIYNYSELRQLLERRGHNFDSRTDSEVVLKSWAEWGSGAVERFNGMFAFAIWDAIRQQLSLVRDRYGIKPIYYSVVGQSLVFGSEQRAINQHPLVGRRLDKIAVAEYLTFQNILSDRTFNADIRVLPPGHILQVGRRPRSFQLVKYWDFRFESNDTHSDPRSTVEELERLLRQAVQRQLQSDVEVGAYLSGGVDSSTIATIASKEVAELRTFTCGFDTSVSSPNEFRFDESSDAGELAEELRTRHSKLVVGPADLVNTYDKVARQLEEPRLGQSYPNFLIANLASKSVKVVLSGAGGDEVFGGYPWRYKAALENTGEADFRSQYFRYWNRLVADSHLRTLLAPVWKEISDFEPRELFDSVISQHEGGADSPSRFLDDSLYFEAKTFLHGLLIVEDKLSMAHGLETRLPFLDNDVVDFATKCSLADRFGSVPSQEQPESVAGIKSEFPAGVPEVMGKMVLRRLLARIASGRVAFRPKQGFAAPDTEWLSRLTAGLLESDSSFGSLSRILDRKALLEYVSNGESDISGGRLMGWSMLSLRTALAELEA